MLIKIFNIVSRGGFQFLIYLFIYMEIIIYIYI
jgi:hypothetical protein